MSRLAIIDLDGVIADNTARFERARRADDSIDWRVVFDPVLVELDTLIDGAKSAIEALSRQSYTVQFLTSRPESMREATLAWLAKHGLGGYELVMKPRSAQFTKTTKWKADEVRRLAEQHDAVIFVDDEAANRGAVEALGVVCYERLADALAIRE